MVIFFFNKIKKYKIKYLSKKIQKSFGKNNLGHITSKYKGGGIKISNYKIIDFTYVNYGLFSQSAIFVKIIYDFFRKFYIGIYYFFIGILKKTYRYFLLTKNLHLGAQINFGVNASINTGNALPLYKIFPGSYIYNIEIKSKKKASLVRNAKYSAIILLIGDLYVTIKLPSGEIKLLCKNLFCIIGQLLIKKRIEKNYMKKAGYKRKWFSLRPKVRGSAMNACDHPHGGGEGKALIGYKFPRTLWGKAFKGIKTRKKNKKLSRFIIQTRK
ncbi:50s ribosomal protein l2 (apicoplast) [Cystoisospora suis]|uniref:50s ribosomal protein l2 n=1 Tax=Cystoisospora suis TaxID=483139 RepID=A0A2C6LCQ3_9APIC|nr:50s ribosomal protein l2 [Cystoisospora suis]